MKRTIEIDGERRDIDIRAMDESFIVYRKMFAPPLTPDNIGKVNPGDPEYLAAQLANGRFKIIEEFFRKQVQIVGSCMILAWDGAGVIGKMHFTTREMHEAIGGPEQWTSPSCYCVDHDGFAPKLQGFSHEELALLLTSASRTLRVLCFNIGHRDERYQGQGMATAMLEYLAQWARERNWRRIEVRSCPDITPTTVIGDWMLRRGPLERRGFHVLEETRVSPDDASRRMREIDEFLAGKGDYPKWAEPYAHTVHHLAAHSVRRSEYDKDYLMACDL